MSRAWILVGSAGALALVFVGGALLLRRDPAPGAVAAPVEVDTEDVGIPTESEPEAALERAEIEELQAVPQGSDGVEDTPPPLSDDSASSPDLAAELERIAQGFLTDDPDLTGFDRALSRLAEQARVDEASVRVDPRDGRVTGELDLGPGLPRARFSIEGDSTRVELTSSVRDAERSGLLLRTTDLGFTSDSAGLSSSFASLQFHPDTRRASGEFLETGVETYAGWTASSDPGRTVVRPIAMRAAADGRAWEIGHARTLETHGQPWAVGADACRTLDLKLRGVGR